MKKEWIPTMKQTGKLKMKFSHLIVHYLIVLILLLPIALTIFILYKIYILDTSVGEIRPDVLIKATLPIALIAIIYFLIRKNKLKFKTIQTNIPIEKIKDIIEMTAKELEWSLVDIDEKIIIAKTHPKWTTGSWGEQITIIVDNSQVMINSICDPAKPFSVISMDSSTGRNKRNMNTLIKNIKAANR